MNVAISKAAVRMRRIVDHVKCDSHIRTVSFFSKHKKIDVFDAQMSYYDSGVSKADKAIVFLHGNPTSSYLWRNVIPHVESVGRCLAPDLVGMGRSSKIPGSMYTFQDHYKYLEKWMDSVNLPNKVDLVIHDWGSALGFHWANMHRNRVSSITFMEALVTPMTWEQFPEAGRKIFQAMLSPAGDDMILQKNLFVQNILPASILRQLSDEEMEVYLEPFKDAGEDRRPTLTWPRQIPIKPDGPDDVIKLTDDYNRWLSRSSDLPKLHIGADPGFFSSFIKDQIRSWPNLESAEVAGLHFLQEDSPEQVGKTIEQFLVNKVHK